MERVTKRFETILFFLVLIAFVEVQAGEITSNFTAGDTLTATQMTEVKDAVNDNDASNINKQMRVTGSCPPGKAIVAINADGTVNCSQLFAHVLAGMLPADGSLSTNEPTWIRPNANSSDGSCESSTILGPMHFQTHTLTNSSGVDKTFNVEAKWEGADGYLFVYNYPFDSASSLTNCVIGDDDGPSGTATSEVSGVTVAAFSTVIIVATTFSSNVTMNSYSLDVTVVP